MEISILAAMDLNRGMGNKEALPWPEPIKPDWENLYTVSLGKKMIMGRKSYTDQHRVWSEAGNFVVSSDPKLEMDSGFIKVNSLKKALALCEGEDELFVIGGQMLFEEAIDLADNLHITIVNKTFEADRFFPAFDWNNYITVSQKSFKAGSDSPYDIDIFHLRKKGI
jgi:dihydrofolate reductase